jgi:hypothetical protein
MPVHPGVQLVPATPLNSQESADTHVTLLTAPPLVPGLTQANLPVPDGPAHGTCSCSRSRSVLSTTLEAGGSLVHQQTRSPSRSEQSGTSNMDLDELKKRGHKRKASNTKTECEERRQQK